MTELRVISKINPEASDADLMVPEIHDRILDAYFGKMGDQFMRDTQKRVHWVCGMAKGPRVLDIGCSQGIVPVLLGREGYTVTGIDSDSQAIAAAKTFLADQKPNVQTKVNFIHADFISFPFDGALFDTAIVSEVLEHLVDPASFVSRAAERLSPGGTLIVTVPFGINDFIDHKWTFYALEPLRLVWELFSVDEVEVFGKWIGFSCRKRNSKAKKGLTEWPWSLLEKMEKTFYVNERALLSQTEAVRAKLDEANNKYRSITEQVSLLKETLSRQEASQKKVDGLLQQSQVQLELVQSQAANERTEFKQQIVFLGEEVQAKSDAAHEVEKQLLRREAELEVVRGQIVAAELSYRSVVEQVVTLKEQLSKQESVRKRAEETQAQTIAELKKIQGQLDEQRSGFQQEIARLTADSLAKSTAAHKLEKQLHRRDVELEAVRGEVNLAEQKYRSGTEQLADIKEQLTQQEASRKLTEEIQAQTKSQMSRLSDECKGFQREIARLTADNRDKNDLIQKFEKELIHRQDELKLLCSRLEDVNQKYLIGSAQIETLQHDLEEAKSDRIIIENELKESLNNANIKYRQVTGQQIPLLKQKLELQNQRHKEKTELLRREAEVTASKVRDTLSFRLGYILLHCLKSHRNFMRLPKDLWLLRRESVRRRQKKFTLDLPVLKRKPEGGSEAPVRAAGPSIRADSVSILLSQHTIPQLNMTTGLVNLRVACIMDEFTFSSYAPECKLTQLTPTGWKAELESSAPELLFIESAWRGKDDLWGNKVGHTSQELQGVVEWCQQRRIPTLFWNKEDPVHFETFLNTARLFDYVFTTDIDCIHRYKAALKHERVFLLPFACQPKSHNPIEKYARKDAFCFAGAYYARYPERIKDLESFVDELPAFKPLEIFDRNFGKKDPNYTFPQYYQPCIVGTLLYTEIDRAYKGYRYAINLNSIKQSQSMFARRVYELLASNTITVSNFSRGVRLLFGDLVVTTDNGSEQVRRLKALTADDLNARKFRLAALRKVMQEHTYGQRLAYVASKLSGQKIESLLPKIAVLARAMTRSEITKILANFTRQSYQHATLHLVADKGLFSALPAAEERVVYLKQSQIGKRTVGDQVGDAELVAGMVTGDYYGPHYLQDLALATRYTNVQILGKGAYFCQDNGNVMLQQNDLQYRPTTKLPARSAAIKTGLIANQELFKWVIGLADAVLEAESGLALDEFNYCRNVVSKDEVDVAKHVDDLAGLDTGISVDELLCRAEQIAPESAPEDECVTLSGKAFAKSFSNAPSKAVQLQVTGAHWQVTSTLDDGKHEYLYATEEHRPESLGFKGEVKLYLDVTPGLNIQLVLFFLDAQKQKISHVIKAPNRNQEADIPFGTIWIRFGLRFYAGGSADIKGLVLGHRDLQPVELIGRAEHLLLTNHYPSYEDLYRNGFVHSRVRAYHERGCKVDVFRLRTDEAVSFYEFEDIDVTTGAQEVLHQMLSTGQYKSVLVHFLDPEMWSVLRHHIDQIKVLVWVHGAEIHPWYRREFNITNEQDRVVVKLQSEQRMAFWCRLLKDMPANLQLIFVSSTFAEEVMEDIGFRLPTDRCSVVHNPISTQLFDYRTKPVEQRMKILSIRPYVSRQYANDLSVEAILSLSVMPWFKNLEFRMIGDGRLFDETLEPLRHLDNVIIERRFLSHNEIAELHKDYGVFLCPTRWDSQGVSRDEAMSSGLVPITCNVAAVSEFVDQSCGVLACGEDVTGLAEGIASLYENPERFLLMSEAAASRVRAQCDADTIIGAEMALFTDNHLYPSILNL